VLVDKNRWHNRQPNLDEFLGSFIALGLLGGCGRKSGTLFASAFCILAAHEEF